MSDQRAGGGRRAVLPPHVPRPMPVPRADSPRIAALADAVARGDRGAVAAFWRRLEREQTPLVEQAPAGSTESDHRIVTFVWRGPAHLDVADVVLHANKLTDYNDLTSSLLTRLADTDVWYVSYLLRADWRGTYAFGPMPEPVRPSSRSDPPDRDYWRRLRARTVPDPLNPHTFPNRFSDAPLSLAELPDAPGQRWWRPDPAIPAGEISRHALGSQVLGNERTIHVHTPAGFAPAAGPYPVLVMFDGDVWGTQVPLRHTLDNLIAAGAIPPLVTIMVEPIDLATRSIELGCDEMFLGFLTDELLPWACARWGLTTDPARTIVAGQSLGGLTAAFTAIRAPERFGSVLSQSGSFWYAGDSGAGESEWLTRRLAGVPRLPVAFHLEVGLLEWELLGPTQRLRDVLVGKGYPVSYREYYGGHDHACWRGGVADGLRMLTAGWPTARGGPG